MNRTRSWRRAQRERIIAYTERWMRSNGWFTRPYARWQPTEARQAVRKNAITPHPCSCPSCGNPRRWWSGEEGLTMQERRLLP